MVFSSGSLRGIKFPAKIPSEKQKIVQGFPGENFSTFYKLTKRRDSLHGVKFSEGIPCAKWYFTQRIHLGNNSAWTNILNRDSLREYFQLQICIVILWAE